MKKFIFLKAMITLSLLSSCGNKEQKSQTQDALSINVQNGDIKIFYLDGNYIVIKNCKKWDVVNQRGDCNLNSKRVTIRDFKEEARYMLTYSRSWENIDEDGALYRALSPSMKKVINNLADYESNYGRTLEGIETEKRKIDNDSKRSAEILDEMKKIEQFLESINGRKEEHEKWLSLRSSYQRYQHSISLAVSNRQKLLTKADLLKSYHDVYNNYIDQLINEKIGSGQIHRVLNNDNSEASSLFYQVLSINFSNYL